MAAPPLPPQEREIRHPARERVIGHRGAAALAPENTLAGLRRAAADGVAWVEVDVQLTADGVPVLLHDATLERTTSGSGPLAAATAAEVATLDAGSWFGPAFTGEPVAFLAPALRTAAGLGLAMVLELKAPPDGAALARTALAVALAIQPVPRFLVSSFDLDALAAAQRHAPEVPRALLADGADGWTAADLIATAQRLGCGAVHLDDALATPQTLQVLEQAGLARVVWTVNEPARALALWDQGADAIISDRPAMLLDATTRATPRS
ncbi:glycerophosphodiester phosphodiesterase family protein [Pararhodospirillum photometricum]|uniref:Glycerophosphodiester phosphodiesterase n=1 Tax=Pararhodospirillum photometricum DSM 122 TaxID=1150469 RepID=H6SRN4_PARPM|nr:glycerophosphodiester phosphodiesterase family protein [Pararhodospirillum photometricum]CCG07563.1 Glycerophosphodiester phosphodiesterase [Pararhodospirillum photometricum DSM 122]